MEKSLRNKILEILVVPTTVTELKNKLGKNVKSFGTLAYHLKILEKESLITKDKDNKSQGQPTKYKLVSKEQLKRILNMQEETKKYQLTFLKYIQENPLKDDATMLNDLENMGFNSEIMGDVAFDCSNNKFSVLCHKITKKGESFLKDNK